MKALLLCLVLAGSAWGTETDDIIARFDDEDFDVREAATAALSHYSLEWAKTFLARAAKEETPEIAYRLRLAAKQIYFNESISKSREWLTLHGCLPFGGDPTNLYNIEDRDASQGGPNRVTTYVDCGYLVLWIDDSAKDQIKSRDLVMTCTEGLSWGDIKVEAGKEYQLSLRRYKDPESVGKDASYIDNGNKDFDTKEVTVKAIWKDPRQVPWMDEDAIIQSQWRKFCARLEEEEQNPPEAAAKH